MHLLRKDCSKKSCYWNLEMQWLQKICCWRSLGALVSSIVLLTFLHSTPASNTAKTTINRLKKAKEDIKKENEVYVDKDAE